MAAPVSDGAAQRLAQRAAVMIYLYLHDHADRTGYFDPVGDPQEMSHPDDGYCIPVTGDDGSRVMVHVYPLGKEEDDAGTEP